MDAISSGPTTWAAMGRANEPRVVSAAEFRQLLVSHRRMVRVDPRQDAFRGLRDMDTGELFVTDAQRLLGPRRDVTI